MAKKSELREQFEKTFSKELQEELGIKNVMAIPKLDKIVINAGIGKEYRTNSAVTSEFAEDIAIIAGQKPIVTKSKNAISNFKLRENMDSGLKVTLRGDRMWDFYYRLVNVVLPRVKDFRGISRKSFDKKGNFALGIREHTIFPEIDTSRMVKIRPLQVIICTTATEDDKALALLKKLGMPFKDK
jgi:large subunit ribosomal protein L5